MASRAPRARNQARRSERRATPARRSGATARCSMRPPRSSTGAGTRTHRCRTSPTSSASSRAASITTSTRRKTCSSGSSRRRTTTSTRSSTRSPARRASTRSSDSLSMCASRSSSTSTTSTKMSVYYHDVERLSDDRRAEIYGRRREHERWVVDLISEAQRQKLADPDCRPEGRQQVHLRDDHLAVPVVPARPRPALRRRRDLCELRPERRASATSSADSTPPASAPPPNFT